MLDHVGIVKFFESRNTAAKIESSFEHADFMSLFRRAKFFSFKCFAWFVWISSVTNSSGVFSKAVQVSH